MIQPRFISNRTILLCNKARDFVVCSYDADKKMPWQTSGNWLWWWKSAITFMSPDLSLNSKIQSFPITRRKKERLPNFTRIFKQYRYPISNSLHNSSFNLKKCNLRYRCKATVPRVLFYYCFYKWWHISPICLPYNS